MTETYQPPQEILDKYADVLVNFAIGGGEGVKEGEVVYLQVPECAKPILIALRRAVLKAGAHPIIQYIPDDMAKEYFELATDSHLDFFPEKHIKGKVEQMDHSITICADSDPYELKEIAPKKIMRNQKAFKPYFDWKKEKENKGEFTWTLAKYATPAVCEEAGLTIEEYWEEIIKACYLNHENPVEKWKELTKEMEQIRDKLNELKINKLKIESENTNLVVGLGKDRKWVCARGCNIPSFEIFTSPDYRETQGYFKSTQPLYRYGNIIKDIYLEFKDGKVVDAKANVGEELLKEMIETKGANQIGEVSLTDSRHSPITKFMADTGYDENLGGEYGNTHIALGSSYHDTYSDDQSVPTEEEWEEMGFNDSVIHTDIVSAENRKVTAILEDGSEKVIYENGIFAV